MSYSRDNHLRRYRGKFREARLEQMRRYQKEHREEAYERGRQFRERTRAAVFDHYGWTCACCGRTDHLTIDHINGGGADHRERLFGRRHQGGVSFYRWLIKQDFPAGYQTLCQPCNMSKAGTEACRLH
jgi:hypothetical protein